MQELPCGNLNFRHPRLRRGSRPVRVEWSNSTVGRSPTRVSYAEGRASARARPRDVIEWEHCELAQQCDRSSENRRQGGVLPRGEGNTRGCCGAPERSVATTSTDSQPKRNGSMPVGPAPQPAPSGAMTKDLRVGTPTCRTGRPGGSERAGGKFESALQASLLLVVAIVDNG